MKKNISILYVWGTKRKSVDIANELKNEYAVELVDNNCSESNIGAFNVIMPSNINTFKSLIVIPDYSRKSIKEIRSQLLNIIKVSEEQILEISFEALIYSKDKYGSYRNAFQQENVIHYIESIEFEVAHHCNLNCNGCNHFSPLSKNKMGSFDEFSSDLKHITSFVDYIGEIRLLGGEPLLNNELDRYVICSREMFPRSKIKILTNGILIKRIDERILDAMRECGAVVCITVYPPMKSKMDDNIRYLEDRNIITEIFGESESFVGQVNIEGNSNPVTAELFCQASNCHILESGRLIKCTVGHKLPVYLKYFNIENDYREIGIDIYEKNNVEDILHYLHTSNDMCKFCGMYKCMEWSQVGEKIEKENWYCSQKFI